MIPDTNRRLRSVQVRTTAIAMATVVVVLAFAGFVLVGRFERAQLRQVDVELEGVAQYLERIGAGDDRLPRLALPRTLAQLVDPRGNILFASSRLRGAPPMRTLPGTQGRTGPTTEEIDQVGHVRVIVISFRENFVLLARTLESVDHEVAIFKRALLFALPALAALMAVLIWVVVGKTLRPVRAAMAREEQLLADVSHELRSPIAGVRALLESESTVPDEIELNRLEALTVLGRLESLANSLLAMAAVEERERLEGASPIDLDEVVLRVVGRTAPPSGVEVDVSGVSGGQVLGIEDDLERMIENLVSNGLRHATAAVVITVAERAGEVVLTVGDDGPGIPPDRREEVFERFTRIDGARSRDRGGAGLGLAIARAIALAHAGSIVARESATGGALFVVGLAYTYEAIFARLPARSIAWRAVVPTVSILAIAWHCGLIVQFVTLMMDRQKLEWPRVLVNQLRLPGELPGIIRQLLTDPGSFYKNRQ